VAPTVSIITPTFNSAGTVLRTVESVLAQSFTDWEQIIVDNCSQDQTLSLIRDAYATAGRSAQLKVISEPDKGISDAFNKGILASSGEIVHILNSDDAYCAWDTLSRVVEAFKDPEVDLVHGSIVFEDPVYGSQVRGPLNCPVTDAMPFQHPATFVRRRLYGPVGLFDLSYRYAMDYEWFVRLYQTSTACPPNAQELSLPTLTAMQGDGASATQEYRAIKEGIRALKAHQCYNLRAQAHWAARLFRLKIKKGLPAPLAALLVRQWRKVKW